MDNGILMAIGEDGDFQVVAIASSEEEAAEQAANYLVSISRRLARR